MRFCSLLVIALGSLLSTTQAATRAAGPEDYQQVVRFLQAGDTLLLRPGQYRNGLDVHRLLGQANAPIVIRGAAGPRRSVFVAESRRNTVSIVDSAFVTIADIDLVGGPRTDVDAVKAEGTSRFAHDITLEGLVIRGYGAEQQNVAISTKCPAWNWVIRRNLILGGGTGLYLGNSDGSAPFVSGLIERNIVAGTTGYAMEIKHQRERPRLSGLPVTPAVTIIRFNAFVKDAHSSAGAMARPNVLLGHWPLAGAGESDRYIVHGNIFLDNPHEALLQAEGNFALYNNVFLNRQGNGVAIQAHKDVPRSVDVFHNTIVAQGVGLSVRDGHPQFRQRVASNAVFAGHPGEAAWRNDNFIRGLPEMSRYLRKPAAPLDALDLTPLPGARTDGVFDMRGLEDLPAFTYDFDGVRRLGATAGAYGGGATALRARWRELAAILRRLPGG